MEDRRISRQNQAINRQRILDRVVLIKFKKNRKACAMLVWNFCQRLAVKIGKTIYQVKHELLSDYLLLELKNPTIKFRGPHDFIGIFLLLFEKWQKS